MDYKAGDLLPTVRPSTYKYNCYSRLVMYYSGFLVDNDSSAYYYLHTEHWAESANSVITTLNKVLTKLDRLQPDLVLTLDGHSTNMNNTFLSYLVI